MKVLVTGAYLVSCDFASVVAMIAHTLTGFGPFGHHKINASWEIAKVSYVYRYMYS